MPLEEPIDDARVLSSRCARPKSATQGTPCSLIRMLPGLRSRCSTPPLVECSHACAHALTKLHSPRGGQACCLVVEKLGKIPALCKSENQHGLPNAGAGSDKLNYIAVSDARKSHFTRESLCCQGSLPIGCCSSYAFHGNRLEKVLPRCTVPKEPRPISSFSATSFESMTCVPASREVCHRPSVATKVKKHRANLTCSRDPSSCDY